MVRAELRRLRRVGGRSRREGRRQISARALRFARRGGLGPGFAWIRRHRVPVTARIDPALLLSRQQAGFIDSVTRALTDAQIGFWWLPGPDSRSRTLCLRETDRAQFCATVAGLADPSWYATLLGPRGEVGGELLAASALVGSRAETAAGLRLWEYVVPRPNAGFVAAEEQGITVSFWAEVADDEDVEASAGPAMLHAELSNPVATVLDPRQCRDFGKVPAALRPRQIGTVDFPIDVVYTWVDGSDETWLQTKAKALGSVDPQAFTERAHDESRFADHDELRFSLRSLEQFAPWVNHVWIVTADQHPSWLAPDHPWITVVSHRDVFPDQIGLPTFNSHAIESCLHRVPGLAEHFLYLNDDMILGRPLIPEQFFHPSGIGKFFHSRTLVDYRENVPGEIASSTAAKNARRLLAERYGVTFARKFYHTAAALHVSELTKLETEFADVFAATRRATFRTVHDIAVAGSFYLNYGYLAGTLTPSRLRYDYVDPAAPDARWRMGRLLGTRRFDTFCINDGSTEEAEDQRRRTDQVIRRFLADYLPVPGTFEI